MLKQKNIDKASPKCIDGMRSQERRFKYMKRQPKIALVYDRVNSRGGAEEILKSFHKLIPEAPLYTSVYAKKHLEWIPKTLTVIPSWINAVSFFRSRHQVLGWIMPIVFGRMRPNSTHGVVSITSEFAKGVRHGSGQEHISYILTPTRYLWSHQKFYLAVLRERYGVVGYSVGLFLTEILKKIDLQFSKRPTHLVAISRLVASRIQQYYGRKVESIIYPPVNTSFFSREKVSKSRSKPSYLLWVGRLVPYKRLDLVVEASKILNLSLYVVGVGEQSQWISDQAKHNKQITYLGDVSDIKKRKLMVDASCFIQPGVEDFGITAVEAVSMGTPVIIHAKSGASEVLPESDCGKYIATETIEEICKAINNVLQKQKKGGYREKKMHAIACRCDTVIFEQQWKELLCKTMNMC